MKKHIIKLLLIFCMAIPAMQMQASEEKGLTVGLGLGLSYANHDMYNTEDHVGMIAVPKVGYRLNPRWEVGGMVKYENASTTFDSYIGIGPYSEYTFATTAEGNLRFFARAQAVLSIDASENYNADIDSPDSKGCPFDIGLTPGVAYRIPGSPVDLKLTYLFIGFNNNDRWYKELGGCLGRGNWIIDAGVRRLEIGATVQF